MTPKSAHSAATRLASYGTLAPGKANHHQLGGLTGRWFAGTVRGRLGPASWGEHTGLPGLILDPQGEGVPVQVFESGDLTAHWPRLDAFEGAAFRRVTAKVQSAEGPLEASVYVLVPEG